MTIRIAIIGFGKIAEDQHVPNIKANPAFELVAISSQRGVGGDHAERIFTDHREMLTAMPELDAVSICTPAGPRRDIMHDCLDAKKHVLLEKPPAATLSELADIEDAAANSDRTVFATWHSRYAAAVARTTELLKGQRLKRMHIDWQEDVRKWHPKQDWIWQPGGFGIFDPGINALSIATAISPQPLFLKDAVLKVPANKGQPIAADLSFVGDGLTATLDWRLAEGERWNIDIDTGDGRAFRLTNGASTLKIDGKVEVDEKPAEYAGIYKRFAELIGKGESDVDARPFRLVADAFLLGRREQVESFED